jgi:hypothetical protein
VVKLHELTHINAPVQRCFDLARSVEVHLEGNTHWGETATATGGRTSGLIELGEQVTWRAKHFGFWHQLTSEITAMEQPSFFEDRMTHGIFRFMEHHHFFRVLSPETTEMRDVFTFAAPIPILGKIVELTTLKRYMQRLLRERNAVIRQIAESSVWQKYIP